MIAAVLFVMWEECFRRALHAVISPVPGEGLSSRAEVFFWIGRELSVVVAVLSGSPRFILSNFAAAIADSADDLLRSRQLRTALEQCAAHRLTTVQPDRTPDHFRCHPPIRA